MTRNGKSKVMILEARESGWICLQKDIRLAMRFSARGSRLYEKCSLRNKIKYFTPLRFVFEDGGLDE